MLVIVTAWAVVLVPMLLSRHEAANEVRSVDRFATAMRVLARRSAASSEARYVVVPPRPESTPSVVVNGTTSLTSYVGDASPHHTAYEDVPMEPPRAHEARLHEVRQRVVMRRRRVVLGLVALTLGLLATSLWISAALWIPQALCDVLLVTYLVHLRRETTRMAARRSRAAARVRRAAEQTAAALAASSARLDGLAHLTTPANAVIIERQEDGSWHPVPVPLPTYVTAPVAPSQPAAAAQSSPELDKAGEAAGISTEDDLDRRLDDMERRLAVND